MGKKTKEYQRFFLVDYENVHCSGLDGIKNLSDKDCVRIYYREERKKEEKLTLDFITLLTSPRLILNISRQSGR